MQTIVIGHRNPDMDSICSAIAYAELKRLTGVSGVVAGRAGNTNERIDYVLKKFGVDAPMLVKDLWPRVRDVTQFETTTVREDSSVYEAVQSIEQTRLRGIPVVGSRGECVGLLSALKVLQHLFPPPEGAESARIVSACLAQMLNTFGGKVVCGMPGTEKNEYCLLIGAMAPESFEERMDNYKGDRVVLIVGDRENIQLAAIRKGASALIVTGGLPVTAAVCAEAEKNNVVVMTSPYDTATTMMLARGAATVAQKVDTEYLSFSPDTLLKTARDEAAASGQYIFPVIEGGRLVGVLSKSDFLKTIPRQLILVDHNELSQAVEGASEVPIIEILDHHRLGGIHTDSPILFWNNPVGSTSSIVAMCYRQANVPIPPPIAGLLMAGLISDTLNLTSPTTTPPDVEVMKHLSAVAGVDPAELAAEIFSVGSPLTTLPPAEAINIDCKEFAEGALRFSVAQIEELSFANYASRADALLEALEAHRTKGGYLFSALLVTDISTKNSILLVQGEKAFLKQIDANPAGPHQWEMPGVVSRKKQLLPYLLNCVQQMPVA